MDTEKNWTDMIPDEKREKRFQWRLNADIKFSSPEAAENYRRRVQRLIDVYKVREPDRVPVSLPPGNMPAYMAGLDLRTVMYDYDKLTEAWRRFYVPEAIRGILLAFTQENHHGPDR